VIIEALRKDHDRAGFSSGTEALDRYLLMQASQDARRRVATIFVALLPDTRKVVGYYTLSSYSVLASELPEDARKKLPRYPHIPTTLLGRLAIDVNHRGKGLGGYLLFHALRESWEASFRIASVAVVVDAKDDAAVRFYRHHEFLPFPDDPRRMYLVMSTIEKMLRR